MTGKAEYGAGAKTFHWVTVALLIVQFVLGWTMPNVKSGMQPEALMNIHLSFGIVIAVLVLARLGWRLAHGIPAPEASLGYWQRGLSQCVHALLYILIFGMIFTGWSYASMRGWTVRPFGLFSVPALFAENSLLGRQIGRLHSTLSWVLLGAIGLHVAAALAHLLFWRDGVMQRMLPRFLSLHP